MICIIFFTVIDSYRQKKKKKKQQHGSGRKGSHSSGVNGFSPSFSWDWDGREIKFVMHLETGDEPLV